MKSKKVSAGKVLVKFKSCSNSTTSPVWYYNIKGELGELEFYFKKIPLHQQKFLVVSVLSNSLWLPRNLKNVPK